MHLSDTAVRQAKPATKDYTLGDGDGLSLLVHRNGSKYWFFRYTFAGSKRKMALGTYPEVSLKQARTRRQEARERLANGQDPRASEETKKVKLFSEVCQEWLDFRTPRLTQGRKGSAAQATRYMAKDVLPVLGELPIDQISRSDVLKVIRRVEDRNALNVAEKIRTWLHQLFRFAIVHEYTEMNPATDLDIVAAEQPPVKHNPWLEISELPEFLKALQAYQGSFIVKKGVELLLLTGVRTIELRMAEHGEFDLKKGIWTIPAGRVKQLGKEIKKRGSDVPDYLVPLSTQAIEAIRAIQEHTHQYRLLLPGRNDPTKVLSENTLNQAIIRMGYKDRLTGHGIRGTLSTALYEMGFPEYLVESQLSHKDANKTKDSYNHAKYVEQRRQMMQVWADYLDRLLDQGYDLQSRPQYQPVANVHNGL